PQSLQLVFPLAPTVAPQGQCSRQSCRRTLGPLRLFCPPADKRDRRGIDPLFSRLALCQRQLRVAGLPDDGVDSQHLLRRSTRYPPPYPSTAPPPPCGSAPLRDSGGDCLGCTVELQPRPQHALTSPKHESVLQPVPFSEHLWRLRQHQHPAL